MTSEQAREVIRRIKNERERCMRGRRKHREDRDSLFFSYFHASMAYGHAIKIIKEVMGHDR